MTKVVGVQVPPPAPLQCHLSSQKQVLPAVSAIDSVARYSKGKAEPSMQVTETSADGLSRQYKVVVAAKDINEKLEHRLIKLGKTVKVPGFRPGKVPMQILKQRFGSAVLGEVVERAVEDSSTQAINERGLRPALQPKIEIKSFENGKDLEYEMAVELIPDIEPMDFSTMRLERHRIEVTDEEVAAALEQLANRHRKTQPPAKPRKCRKGDILVIDFKGKVDGEEVPGMSGEDHHLELGANKFIEGFEDQLLGANTDDTKRVKLRFPEAYVNERLAGKEAEFEVHVKQILEPVALEINDELAKAMGESSLESLRAWVLKEIGGEYETLSRLRLKRTVLDELANAHDFPVPTGMVDMEFEAIWRQVEADLKKGRLDPEDQGKSEDELKSEYRGIAERRVRLGLLLAEVGRRNNIQVVPEEENRALRREAQRHPGHEQQVMEFYRRSPEAMANLRAPLFEDKVINFIIDHAKVTERTLTSAEMKAEAEQSHTAPADKGSVVNKGRGTKAKEATKAGGGKGRTRKKQDSDTVEKSDSEPE